MININGFATNFTVKHSFTKKYIWSIPRTYFLFLISVEAIFKIIEY